MTALLLVVLRFYKIHLSPALEYLLGRACRFTPTCSEYTIEALEKYGSVKGLRMGLARFSRCHPFGGSGFDPVK